MVLGLGMSGMYIDFALFARLLMIAQKNVVFVGAPGVGKTRLALDVAFSGVQTPVVVTGKEDMTFGDLVARYAVEEGRPRIVLGELSKAVVSSWIGLDSDFGPIHIVFDEINRCNTDTLLGEVFTALDIEHRMSVPVIRGNAFAYIRRLAEDTADQKELEEQFSSLCDLLGVDKVRDSLKKVIEGVRRKRLDGIPLPYSFRIIATMNVLDRAQLYRLGYALQRRFGFIYVLPPTDGYKPVFEHGEIRDDVPQSLVYKVLSDPNSFVVKQAIRELIIDRVSPDLAGLTNKDCPTLVKIFDSVEDASKIYSQASKQFDDISKLVAFLYKVANDLGVEFGISILVDVAKLYIVATVLGADKGLGLEKIADLVATAFILPQLSAVLPRIRAEAILFGETSHGLRKLREALSILEKVFGSSSMTVKMVGGLSVELPSISVHGG